MLLSRSIFASRQLLAPNKTCRLETPIDPNEHAAVPRVGERLEPTMAQAERKDSEMPADENPLALRTRDSNVYWREACGLVSKEGLRYDEIICVLAGRECNTSTSFDQTASGDSQGEPDRLPLLSTESYPATEPSRHNEAVVGNQSDFVVLGP